MGEGPGRVLKAPAGWEVFGRLEEWAASRGCYSTPGCGRQASDLDRPAPAGSRGRPPSKVGGLCHEFRVWGLGFRV